MKKQKLTNNADEILKELDKDSKTRVFTGYFKIAFSAIMIAYAVYMIMSATIIKNQTSYTTLPLFVGLSLFLGFIKYPACKKDATKVNCIPWYDIILAVLSLAVYLYPVIKQNQIIYQGGDITKFQVVIGIVAILLLIEMCRRATGIPLIVVASVFIIYATIWLFNNNPKTVVDNLIFNLFYNLNCGIMSTPISVCSTFVVIFIIFGSFLEKTNIGGFFIDLANSVVGTASGGPAKVAVVSSALMGMYSGSSVANTVGSGAITIPMMKKTGYKPEFAAAVEAAASTGGQIMPPIMGAAAFLMSQITGISYFTIVISAILPAVLYFTGIFIAVHIEAKRLGLQGLPKDSVPKFFKLLLKKGYLLLPVVVLVVAMNYYTAAMSACVAILFAMILGLLDENLIDSLTSKDKEKIKPALMSVGLALIPLAVFLITFAFKNLLIGEKTFIALAVASVCSVFSKTAPLNLKTLGKSLENGTGSTLGIAVACGMAGIVSGVVLMTGIGSTLITLIVPLAENYLLLALIMIMLCCIILGMGVPTTANYVIMATITAPILVKAGVPLLAANMFVFYFGIIADITPPVALAAYAGSAIAGSNPLKTGFTATKLAIGAFIIPYIFALNPAMLFIDTTWYEVILIVVTSLIGMFGVSIGVQGYVKGKVNPILRIVSVIGGLALIYPGLITDAIGLVLVGGVLVYQILMSKKRTVVTE